MRRSFSCLADELVDSLVLVVEIPSFSGDGRYFLAGG